MKKKALPIILTWCKISYFIFEFL